MWSLIDLFVCISARTSRNVQVYLPGLGEWSELLENWCQSYRLSSQ